MHEPQLQHASQALNNLIDLTRDSTWQAWSGGEYSKPVHSIIQALAGNSLFQRLAILMAACKAHATHDHGNLIPIEMLLVHLMSAYTSTAQALSSAVLSQHAPWVLLSVPNIFNCSSTLRSHLCMMIPIMLSSILPLSPRDIQGKFSAAVSQLSARANDNSANVVIYCFHTLSALVHGVRCSTGSMTAQHAVAFSRMGRQLVSLLPHAACVQLSGVLINVSRQDRGSLEVSVPQCFSGITVHAHDDADSAFTPGARWFLPSDPVELGPGQRLPQSAPEAVSFPTPVAGIQALEAMVKACVGDDSFSASDAVQELSLWLFTVLSISQLNPLLLETVVTAWSTARCQLVRSIWQNGLRMHMRDGFVDSNATPSPPGTWQLSEVAQPWMVPLMILCAVFSQYASTAPDEALFGEKVPPLITASILQKSSG